MLNVCCYWITIAYYGLELFMMRISRAINTHTHTQERKFFTEGAKGGSWGPESLFINKQLSWTFVVLCGMLSLTNRHKQSTSTAHSIKNINYERKRCFFAIHFESIPRSLCFIWFAIYRTYSTDPSYVAQKYKMNEEKNPFSGKLIKINTCFFMLRPGTAENTNRRRVEGNQFLVIFLFGIRKFCVLFLFRNTPTDGEKTQQLN